MVQVKNRFQIKGIIATGSVGCTRASGIR